MSKLPKGFIEVTAISIKNPRYSNDFMFCEPSKFLIQIKDVIAVGRNEIEFSVTRLKTEESYEEILAKIKEAQDQHKEDE